MIMHLRGTLGEENSRLITMGVLTVQEEKPEFTVDFGLL